MIILNEKNYAEECLKTGVIDSKPFNTLSILAKYYYHHLGYKKKKISELLNEYMQNNYPRYENNKNMWIESIEKIASKAGSFKLYELDGVWITSKELETISCIKNKVLERLAFTLLCLAKFSNLRNENNNGWVNNDIKEIFKLARISGSVADRDYRLYDLKQLDLIEFAARLENTSIRIKFIDDSSENVLHIADFRELGYEYLKYCGENFIRCQECGILVRNNKTGTKKYCKDCSGYTPQITKKVKCIECGDEVLVLSKNNKTCRCIDCQQIFDIKNKKKTNKKYYLKNKTLAI